MGVLQQADETTIGREDAQRHGARFGRAEGDRRGRVAWVWDVLPDWFPIQGGDIMLQQCCCLLCSAGLYGWISLAVIIFALGYTFKRLSTGGLRNAVVPILVLLVVPSFAFVLYVSTDDIEQAFQNAQSAIAS